MQMVLATRHPSFIQTLRKGALWIFHNEISQICVGPGTGEQCQTRRAPFMVWILALQTGFVHVSCSAWWIFTTPSTFLCACQKKEDKNHWNSHLFWPPECWTESCLAVNMTDQQQELFLKRQHNFWKLWVVELDVSCAATDQRFTSNECTCQLA